MVTLQGLKDGAMGPNYGRTTLFWQHITAQQRHHTGGDVAIHVKRARRERNSKASWLMLTDSDNQARASKMECLGLHHACTAHNDDNLAKNICPTLTIPGHIHVADAVFVSGTQSVATVQLCKRPSPLQLFKAVISL